MILPRVPLVLTGLDGVNEAVLATGLLGIMVNRRRVGNDADRSNLLNILTFPINATLEGFTHVPCENSKCMCEGYVHV
jgi:hypothetical protein